MARVIATVAPSAANLARAGEATSGVAASFHDARVWGITGWGIAAMDGFVPERASVDTAFVVPPISSVLTMRSTDARDSGEPNSRSAWAQR